MINSSVETEIFVGSDVGFKSTFRISHIRFAANTLIMWEKLEEYQGAQGYSDSLWTDDIMFESEFS